ncbi:MAG: lytic murein transglycosylase [Thiotrichaceae bacterium]
MSVKRKYIQYWVKGWAVVVLFVVSAVAETPDYDGVSFNQWKANFQSYALEKDITEETLKRVLTDLKVDYKVINLISNQPEFTKSIWEYLDTAASKKRIQRGRRLLARHNELLTRIEKVYGVQPEYIVAIWGLESSYGRNFGSHNVVRSLASLAYGSERKSFFQNELVAALKIIQNDHFDVKELKGSWAGAMGHTQFMPSTYEKFAVNFDKVDRKDLWNSLDDVFASTANYLEKSGWKEGQTWGLEVSLPDKFDWELAAPTLWLSISEWAEYGLIRADGRPLNGLDKKEARLFLPAGHNGPIFLTYKNFQVIKQYNNADAYALAVGYLGDRIRGGKEIIHEWPRKDAALSLIEKKDLQFLLTVLGYDTGGVDGKIGPNTREALRAWQKDMGIPADGYVNEGILELLR